MYSAENHLWGWIGYGLGALLMVAFCWWLVRPIKWPLLRQWLCLSVAVLLMMPVAVTGSEGYYTPALMTLLYESLLGADDVNQLAAATSAVVVGYIVVMLIFAGCHLGYYFLRRKSQPVVRRTPPMQESAPESTSVAD